MSTLRRRLLGDSSTEPSRDPSPVKGEPVQLVSTSHLQKLNKRRGKRRQWLVFGLGGLFGIVLAAFFAQRHDVLNLEGLLDINLESILDVIPVGIVNDAKDITVCGLGQPITGNGQAGAEADTACGDSGMSVRWSITIPFLLACIFSRKA